MIELGICGIAGLRRWPWWTPLLVLLLAVALIEATYDHGLTRQIAAQTAVAGCPLLYALGRGVRWIWDRRATQASKVPGAAASTSAPRL